MYESVYIFLLLLLWSCYLRTIADERELFCYNQDGERVCGGDEFLHLTRIDGKEVGTVHKLYVDGRNLEMTTLSLQPLILEIPNMLTDEECDHFISVAKQEGLKDSSTGKNGGDNTFNILDLDDNKQLNILEMRITIENAFDVYLTDEDILQMYIHTGIDKNGDGNITQEELGRLRPAEMERYIKKFAHFQPEKQSRYSQQAWLYPDKSVDKTFSQVQERVSEVINLPIDVVRLSNFQIVKYGVKGHYNAHHDSSRVDDSIPCCERFDTRQCRVCRYMTILFYLNDVEEGGATAFVLSENDTFATNQVEFSEQVNLYRKCSDAKIRVKPSKGKAIMWYNHFIDHKTKWMGPMDLQTLHGGCPVIKGEKWIANFWLRPTDDRKHDIERIKIMRYKMPRKPKTEL
ncbi:transmembrane prolyl 4-hydroxylase [Patella vulgata]|uniref:transmembrane prolyl 4-hydroxylase n=1 Tax=Patella vulgata TaxID=6465 RepID=UPI0024A9DC86|nr:transmembrane prolyl 4-hydroxylase [Patella vulgata]